MKRAVEEKQLSPPIVIKVKWIDGKRFVAKDDKGHSIVMDASVEHGGEGSGFGPMQLLLAAYGGCTGMDVAEIMHKQRQNLEGLDITVSGQRVSEHPRIYEKIQIEYKLMGKDLRDKAVKRAIQLSQDTYCSVGATLKAKAKVSYQYSVQHT